MLLPSGNNVYSITPIYPGSNFTWGEATKKCTRSIQDLYLDRILVVSAIQVERSIIETAKQLDRLRAKLDNRPLHINSWYRSQAVNARVGGAKYSRHQYGDAVDLRSDYFAPRKIYNLAEPDHLGGIGCYYNFVHIDWRGNKARW